MDIQLFMALLRTLKATHINHDMVGYTITEQLEPIRRADIQAFAAATGDTNPAYQQQPALAPPLYLYRLIFPMIRNLWLLPDLKLNVLRAVYAEQEIHYNRPLREGDALRVTLTVGDIVDTSAGELLQVDFKGTVADEPVIDGIAGIMVRRKKRSTKPIKEPGTTPPERFRLPVITNDGQQLQFAEVSGDHNFIHTSTVLAKLAGLPRTIMHGACVMAMGCQTLLEKVAGNNVHHLAGIRGRFGRPVIPGESLELVAYENENDREIPFELFNRERKAVFKNGLMVLK